MRLFGSVARTLLALSCVLEHSAFTAKAIVLDASNDDQVREAAKLVAARLVDYYVKNVQDGTTLENMQGGILGMLPYPPYYWWEAGAFFGSLIDYWYYTGDDTYNQLVVDGIQEQVGAEYNFLPADWAKDIGNDDQLFWAFAVMSAAEYGFPDPPEGEPGWLALAQSVMNQLIWRYDNDPPACNGGIRWQNTIMKSGFNYKNTAANGGMFQLGARLAKYTGNKTYEDYAMKAFDWMLQSHLVDDDYRVNDGTDVLKGCVDADHTQWTYNYGIMIGGAATMYEYTNGSAIWRKHLQGFLNATEHLFPKETGNVMVEICEKNQRCNTDQWSFKAYLSRWLAVAAQLAPFSAAQVEPILQRSAQAAARTCNDLNECGSRWNFDSFDGSTGVGQQMSALSIITGNLFKKAKKQVTSKTGGTSKGNPEAGTGDQHVEVKFNYISTAGKAGAWILTVVISIVLFSGTWWMLTGE